MSDAATAHTAKLRELYALELAGRFESPEADAIRDQMADLWRKLTATEKAAAYKLSNRLNAGVGTTPPGSGPGG